MLLLNRSTQLVIALFNRLIYPSKHTYRGDIMAKSTATKSKRTKSTRTKPAARLTKKITPVQGSSIKISVKKDIPILIKVLAVTNFIGAAANMVLGLIFILAAGFMANLLQEIPFIAKLGSTLFIGLGILLFAMGILSFFIGRGLWLGQNWARITLIVMHVLGVPFGVYSIIMGNYVSIISLMLSLLVLGYLILSEDVKKAFA